MTSPFPIGSMLRIDRSPTEAEQADSGWRYFFQGVSFILEEYATEQEADDGVAYVMGITESSFNTAIVPTDAVKLVFTPEEVASRSLPTPETLLNIMDFFGGNDDIDVFQTERTDDDSVLRLYGNTSDGLHFTFEVTVDNIEKYTP